MGCRYGAVIINTKPVLALFYANAHLLKLSGQRFLMARNDVFNCDFSSRRRSGNHICTGLYLIRNNGIHLDAVQLRNPGDFNDVRSCTADLGAHGIQEIGDVYHVRFSGTVFNHCLSRRLTCCKHQIDRSSNGNHVQINIVPMQKSALVICLRRNLTISFHDVDAKRLKAL